MKPVTPAEIRSLDDYELARTELRRRILEVKARRRVPVGEHLTVLFENHDTVLYQIQEMLRVERIVEPAAIKHEIDTYNELIAGPDELRATLLVEYADPTERDRRLRELIGLDEHVWLEVTVAGVGGAGGAGDAGGAGGAGDAADAADAADAGGAASAGDAGAAGAVGRCAAVFDERQLSARRISSVHYVTFALGRRLASVLRDGARGGGADVSEVGAAICVDHPAMRVRAKLGREHMAALAADLRYD